MALRHFLTLDDFSADELEYVVARAIELKRLWRDGVIYEPLRNRTLAMIFTNASTRTRVAFDAGMRQLGGGSIFLSANDTHLGRGEPIADTARVLAEMVDLVAIRTTDHATLEAYAAASRIPVINAMTDRVHPCQILADVQTYVEERGSIRGRTVAFVGDGYNMCHSFIAAARMFGFHLNIACPNGYAPDPELLRVNANHLTMCETPAAAIANVDLVVTDVWSSMGHEEQQAARRAAFAGYQINEQSIRSAHSDALFMHCLPAHRGEEISDGMLDHPASVAWQEAGNRLHSQKALIEFLFTQAQPARGAS